MKFIIITTRIQKFHSHDYYEFYFFLEGDISIQIEDCQYLVSFGDVMLIPPNIPHRPIIHSRKTAYRRFVLWITQEYCCQLSCLSEDYIYLTRHVAQNREYLFHCDRVTFNSVQAKALALIEEMQSNRFGKEAQIFLYLNDLILYINRFVYEQKHPRRAADELSIYQKLCSFIENHLDEDLSLDRLAREFFVNKYYISHVFKDNLGFSIHLFITKKRLELCREAIISSSGITEAFQLAGFGDYSSFYRAFKREYGVSPKEYQDMQTLPR